MKDVNLDFRPPFPEKIATGLFTPRKWGPFEICLPITITWTIGRTVLKKFLAFKVATFDVLNGNKFQVDWT
jgi:hypothetical protein